MNFIESQIDLRKRAWKLRSMAENAKTSRMREYFKVLADRWDMLANMCKVTPRMCINCKAVEACIKWAAEGECWLKNASPMSSYKFSSPASYKGPPPQTY